MNREERAEQRARQLTERWGYNLEDAGSLGIVEMVKSQLLIFASEIEEEVRRNRPTIICLYGSTRFVNEMAILAWELEKDGNIVLGLHILPASYPEVQDDHQAEAENVKERMDQLHLRKIDLADKIFVCNIGGYIGDST